MKVLWRQAAVLYRERDKCCQVLKRWVKAFQASFNRNVVEDASHACIHSAVACWEAEKCKRNSLAAAMCGSDFNTNVGFSRLLETDASVPLSVFQDVKG